MSFRGARRGHQDPVPAVALKNTIQIVGVEGLEQLVFERDVAHGHHLFDRDPSGDGHAVTAAGLRSALAAVTACALASVVRALCVS